MPLTSITPDADTWDSLVSTHPRGHLLQTTAWGELKAAFGWTPARAALAQSGRPRDLVAGAQVLFQRLPFRLGWWGYVPFGPVVDWADDEQVRAVFAALDGVARQRGAAFLKLEPGFDLAGIDWPGYGLHPSPQTVQPPRTIRIDLSGGEDVILARMNQGTRRNIRKSEKFGVVVREGTRADVDSFNAMIRRTGDRQDFGVHAPEYYQRAYDLFAARGQAALMIGSAEGRDLAGVMVFALGGQAWYLYGASLDAERHRMASYGVQWAAIRWAMARGARTYDLYGVPDAAPEDLEAQFETRSDGLWGVYRFKRGWGGEVIRSAGAWDRVYSATVYAFYRLAVRVMSAH